MRILNLALKDIKQMFRDKRSLLFLIAMPIAFTIFMGFAYPGSSQSDEEVDYRIPLALVDLEPESRLNKNFFIRLESSDSIKVIVMKEEDAMGALRKDDVAGVLIIPVGFSDQVSAGKEAQLTLIADPNSAQGQSLYQLLRVPISQLLSAVEVSRETVDIVGASEPSAEQNAAFDFAWNKWDEASKVSLVKVEQAMIEEESDWTGGNPYNQASPGILVQFAIFGLVTSAQIFVQEKNSRTLQRLITTAMKPWEIVAGHMLAMFVIVMSQMVMLVVFGQLVLKVNYMREPLAVLLVVVMLGFWVACMGLLVGVIAKDEQQVILYSMIAMFLFSGLGGTWFPLEATGGTFSAIGTVMPSAWAMNGLQNILIRGLGLESIMLPTGMLLAYALLFFGLAVWQFRKMKL